MFFVRLTIGIVAALAPLGADAAEVRVGNRDELQRALADAGPGTTILLAAGEYRGGLDRAKLTGAKDRPIVIAGADPEHPPTIVGGQSGIHLSSPSFVELRDLVIKQAAGNGLNIDDSGSVDTPAHDVVLRNVIVSDIGPRGNCDGIKLSGVRDFRVQGCRVERWGTSGSAIDMVGCQDGVVQGCTFANAAGDEANGVQMKGGSSKIVVQFCRFERAGGRAVNVGGSTGRDYFRPRDATFEAKEITVEDCEMIGGMSAVAFVGVDGAVVRHNTIYRPTRWAFRILQENTDARMNPSRGGKVEKNLIVFRSDELREAVNIGGKTAPETFAFVGNAWNCLDRPEGTKRAVRLPTAEKEGSYGAAPKFVDAEKGDLRISDRTDESPGARRKK